jgi:hypothetical protein
MQPKRKNVRTGGAGNQCDACRAFALGEHSYLITFEEDWKEAKWRKIGLISEKYGEKCKKRVC